MTGEVPRPQKPEHLFFQFDYDIGAKPFDPLPQTSPVPPRPSPRLRAFVSLSVAVAVATCGGSPIDPTPITLRVTSVQPTSGSSFGGTVVTVTGAGFSAGASVTIGGVAATNVLVNGPTSLSATTAPRAAGAADVTVDQGGRQASLQTAFTFVAPTVGPNTPPLVGALSALGPRMNQPAGMADLDETLLVGATVTDAETAPAALVYEWTATVGTFSGAGAALMWRAPSVLPSTPADTTLTVTVIERYVEPDAQGLPVAREHRVTRTTVVRIHDSSAEIRGMAERFLRLFSMSTVPTAEVLSDFSPTCDGGAGRRDEAIDVDFNRCAFTITSFNVGSAQPPAFHFGGRCTLIQKAQPRSDACTLVPVRWVSTIKANALSCPGAAGRGDIVPGRQTTAEGLDQVTAVYEGGRWRLCHSTFDGAETLGVKFKR